MMAFITVPIPGFCRNGIHASNTIKLTTNVVTPILVPVWIATPWASTVHGLTPIPAEISNVSPSPNRNKPKLRKNNVVNLGRKFSGFGELHPVTGILLTMNIRIKPYKAERCPML